MEALGGEEVSSYSFTTSALDGDEWSASRPGRAFTPGERTPGAHYTGAWVGPRAGLDTEARVVGLCIIFLTIACFYIYVLDSILHKVLFSQSFLLISRTCLALIILWNEHICQKYICEDYWPVSHYEIHLRENFEYKDTFQITLSPRLNTHFSDIPFKVIFPDELCTYFKFVKCLMLSTASLV
jgi:hypothetical protein